jgi:FkbH-like protein
MFGNKKNQNKTFFYMKTFKELTKNLKKDTSGLKQIKIAVLADSSSQLFVKAILASGIESGIAFQMFEAEYDQVDLMINDPTSDLYKSASDYVIIFNSVHSLQKKFFNSEVNNREMFADGFLQKIESYIDKIGQSAPGTRIIYLNFPLFHDSVFGHFGNSLKISWIYQLRKINFGLMNLAVSNPVMSIVDIDVISSEAGYTEVFDTRLYIHADMIYALDFLPKIAKAICDIISAQQGKIKKCLILDLDNTLWGGIIGDDGMENIELGDLGIGKAFSSLQIWAKELKERGIILAICSKNTETIAREPFEKHPDMILKLDDIAVFVANWENKAENIRYIQSVLNIGFDSMVFIDDNPFERGMVRNFLPEVVVPELPEDPSEYMTFLRSLNLFETASYSKEDSHRTKLYKEESMREMLKKSFVSEDEYLGNLDMIAEIQEFNKFTIPRIAQLSQRSNQFNLRTIRYSEDDLNRISQSDEYENFSISLKDKFGEYGLIAVVVLKKFVADKEIFIENWFMSCRVLKRGIENLTLNKIAEIGLSNGMRKLKGGYIKTSKNGMVQNHYEKLNFAPLGNDLWELDLATFTPISTNISVTK